MTRPSEGFGVAGDGALRAPVVLFAFNRPALTARVFAAIRAARPTRLFLVCDGPRAEREGEAARCADVRRIIDAVDWPCEVERNFSEGNLGCRARIASGIAWVFERSEEAIFLEDDTLPDASFFRYCDELLARYRDDERVMMVSGFSLLAAGEAAPETAGASYWFSAHPRIWGWASWARAWRGYDVTMREWPAFKETQGWAARTGEEQGAWGAFFQDVKDGRADTWDAQLTLLAWGTGRLSVIPSSNLVVNIGFGAESTNTRAPAYTGPVATPMVFPLVHPAAVAGSAPLDARSVQRQFGAPMTRMTRMRRLWRRVLIRLGAP